jgi:hypothetical protein
MMGTKEHMQRLMGTAPDDADANGANAGNSDAAFNQFYGTSNAGDNAGDAGQKIDSALPSGAPAEAPGKSALAAASTLPAASAVFGGYTEPIAHHLMQMSDPDTKMITVKLGFSGKPEDIVTPDITLTNGGDPVNLAGKESVPIFEIYIVEASNSGAATLGFNVDSAVFTAAKPSRFAQTGDWVLLEVDPKHCGPVAPVLLHRAAPSQLHADIQKKFPGAIDTDVMKGVVPSGKKLMIAKNTLAEHAILLELEDCRQSGENIGSPVKDLDDQLAVNSEFAYRALNIMAKKMKNTKDVFDFNQLKVKARRTVLAQVANKESSTTNTWLDVAEGANKKAGETFTATVTLLIKMPHSAQLGGGGGAVADET